MADRGAKNFLFLSRSGADKPNAAEVVHELRSRGVVVVVCKGSVTSAEDVNRAVHLAPTPIRGVIQASMVLKDGLFMNMDHEAFHRVLAPKVWGTLNLHQALLASPLDFFLLTSSISGTLGTITQSNYCAANAFLDYFARFRQSQSLPCVSLGVGVVSGVGYVAEHPDVEEALRRNGLYAIDERKFLYTIEMAIMGSSQAVRGMEHDPSAVAFLLTGLEPGRLVERARAGARAVWTKDPRLSGVMKALEEVEAGVSGYKGTASAIESLKHSWKAGSQQQLEAVLGLVREILSSLLLLPQERLLPEAKLADVGIDSWLRRRFEPACPAVTVKSLTGVVAGAVEKEFRKVEGALET